MTAGSPPRRRRIRLGSVLLAAIAIPVALLTLLGLERFPLLPDDLNAGVVSISQLLIQVVSTVGAIAVIIGVMNLSGVHLRNLRRGLSGFYSLITLLTLVAVVAVRILERAGALQAGEGPTLSLTLMDALQVAVESALSGILVFFLVYAAYRMMRRRVTFWGLLFVATVVVVLVGYSQRPGLEFLSALREWILNVPVNAGTRGLLLGVAIGTVVIGVRLLIGQDRTFRE